MTRKIAIIRSATNNPSQLASQKQAITNTLELQGLTASDVEWIVADKNNDDWLANELASDGSDRIEALYVTELDRLSRQRFEVARLLALTEAIGCKVYAVRLFGVDLHSNPMLKVWCLT